MRLEIVRISIGTMNYELAEMDRGCEKEQEVAKTAALLFLTISGTVPLQSLEGASRSEGEVC
jgi:hypothetical protein